MVDQWLYLHQGVAGDPVTVAGVFQAHAAELLRSGLGSEAPADQPFRLEVLVGFAGTGGIPSISVSTGLVETHRSSLRLPVRWEPEPPDALASFTGTLDLETLSEKESELSVFGRYRLTDEHEAPMVVMDAVRATAARLLRAVSMELGRRVPHLAVSTPAVGRLLVRDLMTPAPVTVLEDAPAHTACLLLLQQQVGGLPVVDRAGKVVGVLSESDLLAQEASPRRRSGIAGRHERARRLAATAGQACTRPPLTVSPDCSVREAARRLLDEDVGRLIVMDGDRLVGVLSRHDVLKALSRTPTQLQEHVDAALDALGERGVSAQVLANGAVRVTGTVGARSRAHVVEHAIWSVDGVAAVANDVRWETDDTVLVP